MNDAMVDTKGTELLVVVLLPQNDFFLLVLERTDSDERFMGRVEDGDYFHIPPILSD